MEARMTEAVAQTQPATDFGGMDYLATLPRKLLTVYTPLVEFLVVLLFPFYWMVVTTFKSHDELSNHEEYSLFWIYSDRKCKRMHTSHYCATRIPSYVCTKKYIHNLTLN